ncbi:MAG TPA: four helix bundle protein, partial [Thermoanaerobaculia bacterium]|nr:four helix bundle protein [Thermoanaerobaculia bacterium]
MQLSERTRAFALRIIRLSSALPSNRTADVLARQLLRAGTSPGAHFREALRARSKAEYVAKLNGGLMELEETLYWLELVQDAKLFSSRKLAAIRQETTELIAIFVSLIKKW